MCTFAIQSVHVHFPPARVVCLDMNPSGQHVRQRA